MRTIIVALDVLMALYIASLNTMENCVLLCTISWMLHLSINALNVDHLSYRNRSVVSLFITILVDIYCWPTIIPIAVIVLSISNIFYPRDIINRWNIEYIDSLIILLTICLYSLRAQGLSMYLCVLLSMYDTVELSRRTNNAIAFSVKNFKIVRYIVTNKFESDFMAGSVSGHED